MHSGKKADKPSTEEHGYIAPLASRLESLTRQKRALAAIGRVVHHAPRWRYHQLRSALTLPSNAQRHMQETLAVVRMESSSSQSGLSAGRSTELGLFPASTTLSQYSDERAGQVPD